MVPIFVFGGNLAGVVDESVEAPGRDAELALLESLTATGGAGGGAV
jgi:hypothetical protein